MISSTSPYAIDLSFDSYEQAICGLTDKNSDEYKAVLQQLNAVAINSGDGYKLFKKTLEHFETGKLKFAVPQTNGENMTLQGDDSFPIITFMSNELYDLPWMWFHCVSETDDSKIITVKICYLSVLENESVNNANSYLDVINVIAPDAPKPDNYENYENYKSIYEKEITLADKTTVSALISEIKDDQRIYVKIYKDGMLITIYADKDVLTDEFFKSFDVVLAN